MIFLAKFSSESVTLIGIVWIIFSILLTIFLSKITRGKKRNAQKRSYPHEGDNYLIIPFVRGENFSIR